MKNVRRSGLVVLALGTAMLAGCADDLTTPRVAQEEAVSHRKDVSPRTGRSASGNDAATPPADSRIPGLSFAITATQGSYVLAEARSWKGYAYCSPWNWTWAYSESCTHCSGLTSWAYWYGAGVSLPGSPDSYYPDVYTQAKYGTTVSYSTLRPGDLVFFNDPDLGWNGHVGIYSYTSSGGVDYMVHASSYWGQVVEKPMRYAPITRYARY